MTRPEISKMFQQAKRMVDPPSGYLMALYRARKDLMCEQEYPLEAAAEKAEREKWEEREKARRQEEFKRSFIGRGID